MTRVVGQAVHEGAGHSQDTTKMQANVHPLESGLVVVELHPVPPALWYHRYQLSHKCSYYYLFMYLDLKTGIRITESLSCISNECQCVT